MKNVRTPALSLLASSLALAFSPTLRAQTSELDKVTISVGRGEVRSVQVVGPAEFEKAVPGTSPLLIVSRLPGVNFQSADPLGNYEWSTRFTVRGFNQNQLGFTLDGVPLGDMSYGNLNGLHISRAIISENVIRADLSQGVGALDAASSSNLGGTLQFFSSEPSKKFGARVSQTLGSNNDRRTFMRVDTGDSALGRFYASYAGQSADKWKGSGQQKQDQWNLKWVKDLGRDSRMSAFLNTSDRREIDYQDMSPEMIRRLGYNWDNFYPNWQAAVRASNTLCGNGGSTYVAQCDDAYYAGSGLRKDTLGGVSANLRVAEQVDVHGTVYTHNNKGRGLWYTPYVPSPDGTPISLRTTEYGIDRYGAVLGADLDLGAHQVRVGYWHENNTFDQARRFYATGATNPPSPYDFPSNPFRTQWQYEFVTKTDQFSLADTWSLTKDLSLGLGFKSLHAAIDANLQAGTGRPSGSLTASDGFLPQVGVNYKLSKSDELYATYGKNMRAYQAAGTSGPFSTTVAGFSAVQASLKPETSQTLEAGWRTAGDGWEGSTSVYMVRFKDRQLGVTAGSGIQGNPTILANVGGVLSRGLEASLSMRLAKRFGWYNSLSLQRATYESDVVSGGSVVATSGKHVVDAPNMMFKSALTYDDGAFNASLGLDYMSKRYYTYLNDGSVSGRTLMNLAGGYRWPKALGLSEIALSGGVTNLANKKYVSTIGSNGFVNSDPGGTFATLLPGAPRQLFVTLSAKL